MELFKEDEIKQVNVHAPHLVLLGAGASLAAFPNGDKFENKLPLMNNLIEIVGLEKLIDKTNLTFETNNFEEIYFEISKNKKLRNIRHEMEDLIRKYFSKLEILDEPTVYDYLLLSLREKDFIATFNWDPFLIQAYRRNGKFFKLPKLLFLHGNVEVGYCENGCIKGNNGNYCSKCKEKLVQSNLLYPIGDKNYELDKFISQEWLAFREILKRTFMITIFGYGAPKSDVVAIDIMKNAWKSEGEREFEEIEIIDIRDEEDLIKTWKLFIFSHHYRIKNSFYNSWIANHPRRTGEAYKNQFIEAHFIEDNPIPQKLEFYKLWDWIRNIAQYE